MDKINLSLPEWAFLDGQNHSGNTLPGRDVILHIRTATILEIFPDDNARLKDGIDCLKFNHTNSAGVVEGFVISVHYTFEAERIGNIMRDCAAWYCAYLDWEDRNIIGGDRAGMN